MAENYPYIVRCNDCEFVSQVYLDEQQAMNERDFHSFEHLHSVSIWRYAWEQWTHGDGADGRSAALDFVATLQTA